MGTYPLTLFPNQTITVHINMKCIHITKETVGKDDNYYLHINILNSNFKQTGKIQGFVEWTNSILSWKEVLILECVVEEMTVCKMNARCLGCMIRHFVTYTNVHIPNQNILWCLKDGKTYFSQLKTTPWLYFS